MTGSLPGLPGSYHPSLIEGHLGGDESDDEDDNESTGSSIDQMPTHDIPSALELSDSDSETADDSPTSDTKTVEDVYMVENEGLASQLVKHNPWRTLAKFRNPIKQEELSMYSRFPILRMPAELLLIVAEHLPIESAACLAFTCKVTYVALGTRWFKMPKPNLWNFLLLIETERLNSYACPRCLKLHRPPHTFSEYHGFRCPISRSLVTNLPKTISPGLVKMIGRKYFEDPRASEEYLSWVRMAAKKTTRHIKLVTHVIPRMLDGSLLLRTETYIQPFRNGNLTERSLMELVFYISRNSGYYYSKLPQLCDHQGWISHLPNLSTFTKTFQPTKCRGCRFESSCTWHMARCFPTNRLFNPTRRSLRAPVIACILIHEQPCNSCKQLSEDRYDGEVKGCKKCATDFCISAREVPGLGTCIVLTAWKDIGGIGPGQADNWDRHVTLRLPPYGMVEDDFRSDRQVGQIYKAFENITGGKAGRPKPYRPQTDSKMVRDLSRRVHKRPTRRSAEETTDTEASTDIEEDDEDSS